jgi:hypothetical protein
VSFCARWIDLAGRKSCARATIPRSSPKLSQKFAAQALPVVGALGGASVNYVFIEHFQETAQGHFTVRRLERVYGKDVVRAEYERLANVTEPQAT